MPNERWQGRFIVEYDDVDLEQMSMQAAAERQPMKKLLVEDARKRAAKSYSKLSMRTVSVSGERSARVIFTTEIQSSNNTDEV